MPAYDDFRPSADLDMLRVRSRLLAAVRRYFDERGYCEVDTPILSHDRVIDPHLEPFAAMSADFHSNDSATMARLYLQTSPEFAMKRLLAAGATAIYQVGHVFRFGEVGRLHNPEFTMVEWYRAGDTHLEQMQVVEDLVGQFFKAASTEFRAAQAGTLAEPQENAGRSPWQLPQPPAVPFLRTTYREAFARVLGVDVLRLTAVELADLARLQAVVIPDSLLIDDADEWLNLLLAELIEPTLGKLRPEFLCDYPASQAALACIRPGHPPVAERFELYLSGIELCNGYHELTDPAELRVRIANESIRRQSAGLPALPVTSRLLAAMESGLPPCSGVALGFDRLLMLATGANTVAEVVPFSFERA